MEYQTTQKYISTTPRKLRLVVEMVKKMKPEQAVEMLGFTNKSAALPLSKAIKTALANAGKKEGLYFKKIEINEGPKLKRLRVGTAGRGRSRGYARKQSHIKIVLTDELAMNDAQLSIKSKKSNRKKILNPVQDDTKETKQGETK